MKKLFTLLALFVCTMGAMAQINGTWVNPHNNQPGGFTTVYAELEINNAGNVAPYQGNYTVAAFVGAFGEEEFRMMTLDNAQGLILTPISQNQLEEIHFLILQVPGNYDDVDDTGLPITFMIKDNAKGLIYRLDASEFVTFRESSWGTPSNPVTLSVTLPASFALNTFDVDKGGWVYLPDCVTIEPADATKPANAFIIGDGYTEYAHISNDTIYGDKPVRGARITMEDFNTGENMAETTFNVIQHATAINIVTEEFSVVKAGSYALTLFMTNQNGNYPAYSLTPADANDEVQWEYDTEYITYQSNKNPWYPRKGGTTYIRPYIQNGQQKIYPENPSQIEVIINAPITSAYLNWDADEVDIKCIVGDDIYQRIQNRFVAKPDDAVQTFNVELVNESDNQYLTIGNNSVVAIAPTTEDLYIWIVPTGYNGAAKKFQVKVTIGNPATNVSVAKSQLNFSTTTPKPDIAAGILDNVSYTPEGSLPNITLTTQDQWGSGAITNSEGNIDKKFNIYNDIVEGSHTINVTLVYPDFSNYYGQNSQITFTAINTSFDVVISTGLERFDIEWLPYDGKTYGKIRLTPVPAEAEYKFSEFTKTFGTPEAYTELGWTALNANSWQGLDCYIEVSLPGLYGFSVTKDGADYGSTEFEIPAHISHNFGGWKWSTIPYGDLEGNKVSSFFNSSVVEARTYNDLLINDPSWGFFGTLLTSGISKKQMYKANVGNYANDFYYYLNGTATVDAANNWTLQPGWNWVGSPYFYDRLFTNAIKSQQGLVEGMVIVSKADGQKEYNGITWKGDLNMLKACEGYLVYNPTNAAKTISLPTEKTMTQGNETASARSMHQSVWHYDHSQFANNMTMVAAIPELANAGNYTIGAFVGDECRGEGSFEDGLAFITVHCNSGEQVSFRLHNELTDEYFDIDQTVASRQRIGSLKEPFHMTSTTNEATAISTVLQNDKAAECYDLNGRLLNQQRKGVSLQRQKDGTVRKVVMK